MRALIWKEFRLCWPILLMGVVLLALPYTLLASLENSSTHGLARRVPECATMGFYLTILTMVVLGGNAIAGERNDRSVEFLAYLPVSRLENLVSKIVWPLATVVVIIGVNAAIVFSTWSESAGDFSRLISAENVTVALTLNSLGFSVAWLCSSLLRSPTFAVASGLLSLPIFGGGYYRLAAMFFERQLRSGALSPTLSFTCMGLTLAIVCFLMGCWHYLRRVEP
jgi:ABC-type transport system involved in multi-copper enzyme maturation permease subunit